MDYLAAKELESKQSARSGAGILLLGVLGLIVIAALVLGASSNADTSRNKARQAKPSISVAPNVPSYNAGELVAEAKKNVASGNYYGALALIGDLHPNDLDKPAVQKIYSLAKREKQLSDSKTARLTRIQYAKDYELGLLGAGGDYVVRAAGKNADSLNVTYVLINRPFVFRIQNDSDLNAQWTALGFKSVRLSDGFDSSWSYILK